jgi:uncharacterized protein YndB with AHSA1/START domain
MTIDFEPLIESAVDIAAPPSAVWPLVTDLVGMSERSPQVVKTVVRGGEPIGLGTRTINLNRRGPLFWPTQSEVVRFEPERELAFRIKENWTIWSFHLTPTDGGTHLVQRREAPDGLSGISAGLTKVVLGGQQVFTSELREGMAATLASIKADAERGNRV